MTFAKALLNRRDLRRMRDMKLRYQLEWEAELREANNTPPTRYFPDDEYFRERGIPIPQHGLRHEIDWGKRP